MDISKLVDAVARDMAGPIDKGAFKLNPKDIAKQLEENHFNASVAGKDDFVKAVKTLCLAESMGRGILLTGPNGCGKTQYLKAVWASMTCPDKQWINCLSEVDVQWLRGNDQLYDYNVFIDDLGAERLLYGCEDVIGPFIMNWVERHNPYRRLYISTNLNGALVDERYGGRLFDRIKEWCVIWPMQGESKRKEVVIK